MNKSIVYKLFAVFFLVAVIACERQVENEPEKDVEEIVNEIEEEIEEIEEELIEEIDTTVTDSSGITKIYLKGDEVEIIGNGARVENTQIVISAKGDYWITGVLNNGQLRVSAGDDDKVRLILENVDITNSNNAAIFVEESDQVIIMLADSSVNTLSDSETYNTDEANAVINSKSDLYLTGEGSLTVNANYNDAIAGKDNLIIYSGIYNISAVDDGIRGKDNLVIKNGIFEITAGGDGLKSDNEEAGYGNISISDGDFSINAKGDGVQAQYNLTIVEGIFDIICTGANTESNSSKALKAGGKIQVDGGVFDIESIDDGVHSDNDIVLNGGEFTISTQDDGMHAENVLRVEYADIVVSKSYEGLEAKTLEIIDGNIFVTSSDDGLNAASGDGEIWGPHDASSGDNSLSISGGYIVVNAKGDGVDVNGSVYMTGGKLIVNGPTSNGNGALDYDYNYIMDGGFLIAAGSSGMAQIPSANSAQYSVLINFTSSFQANTIFYLEDSEGNEIITFSPKSSYQSIALSSSMLKNGETYNIYTGGSSSGTEIDGIYNNGKYTPGTLYESFTITSKTTIIGNSTGPGGPGGGPRG